MSAKSEHYPLTEGDVVSVKRSPRDKTSKWERGQIISKLGERSYLVDVNGKGCQRSQNSYLLHQNYQI